MSKSKGLGTGDQLSAAMQALAALQTAVVATKTKSDGIGAGGLHIKPEVFETITGAVVHEFGALRKELGGRMDMFGLEASAVANPDGGGWYLKLVDACGQHVDFKIDRGETTSIHLVVHAHDGMGQIDVELKSRDAIAQLSKLVAATELSEDFKDEVGLATRYLGEVKRALNSATRNKPTKAKSEMEIALKGAAAGKVSDMEKYISLLSGGKFTFRKFENRYDNSDFENVAMELHDNNNNEIHIHCSADEWDDNSAIKTYTAEIEWNLSTENNNTKTKQPSNADDLRKWMRDFNFQQPGLRNNGRGSTTNGSKSLDSKLDRKFVVAVMKYAKKRGFISPDTTKGSLGRLMTL